MQNISKKAASQMIIHHKVVFKYFMPAINSSPPTDV